jgi:beta-N-acetylglucosaminidase
LAITLFVPNGGKEGEGEGEISSESNKMLGDEKQPYLCYRETTKERVHGTNKKEQMRDSKGLYSFTKLQQKQTPHCREVSKMGLQQVKLQRMTVGLSLQLSLRNKLTRLVGQ